MVLGQGIPVGTWRSHFSYSQGLHLTSGNEIIFCAAINGLFNVANNSTEIMDKNVGLSGVSVTALTFLNDLEVLILGYEDGTIDFVFSDEVVPILAIKNANIISERGINDLTRNNDLIYVATDMGIAVLNLSLNEVIDFYREIGPDGAPVIVKDLMLFNDSLFAVTDLGIIAANTESNLLDFNNWYLYQETAGFHSTQLFLMDNQLKVLADGFISSKITSSWDTLMILPEGINHIASFGGNVYALSDATIYQIIGDEMVVVADDSFSAGNELIVLENEFWIADSMEGLVNIKNGITQVFKPQGPIDDVISKLDVVSGAVYGFHAPDPELSNTVNTIGYSIFDGNQWSTNRVADFENISGAISYQDKIFLSSHCYGLYNLTDDNIVLPELLNGAVVTDMAVAEDLLWVTRYSSTTPLGSFDGIDMDFLSSSQLATSNPLSLDVGLGPVLYMRRGGGDNYGLVAYDPFDNYTTVFNINDGLPSSRINDFQVNLDNEVWLATDEGLAYFPRASSLADVQAYPPYFENEILFENEIVNAITFDGGNRLWLGTERGVWAFSESIQTMIHHFTAENSFLPSNHIEKLTYDGKTGALFVLTDKGLVSYQTNSSAPLEANVDVKIYPNPIREDYAGELVITGLVANASVKFTTIEGFILDEIQANGSTASWDLTKFNGERLANGIYLVFASGRDGEETFVGKFAILR